MAVGLSNWKTKSLKDGEVTQLLQRLRQTDNVTNVYYLARTYLFLAATIGGTIWFYHYRAAEGLAWEWNVLVTLLAIFAVGAGQHQLTGLAHDASHHTLFKNRLANDLISDWFCMFPMFGCTHHYRLQHLAHHQFVNDPERDPDVSQLKTSGHWLRFPMQKAAFLGTLLKQLWIPNLIKYISVRAKYNSVGTDKNPYLKKGVKLSKIPALVGVAYLLTLVLTLTAIVYAGSQTLLAIIPTILWGAVMVFYAVIPARMYHQSRVHPVISARAMTLMRMTFFSSLFTGLAWTQMLTGEWAAAYFGLLWIAPMFTTFSFFMILRQLVQHGNGDRGWLTNTRVFFVHPIINFCVFPMGQDHHLPHHMYATVPHYRLRELHEALLDYPEYRDQATVVQGYFVPKHHPPTNPTVLDVLATRGAMRREKEIFIDDSVLDLDEIEEKDEILREGQSLTAPPPKAPQTTLAG